MALFLKNLLEKGVFFLILRTIIGTPAFDGTDTIRATLLLSPSGTSTPPNTLFQKYDMNKENYRPISIFKPFLSQLQPNSSWNISKTFLMVCYVTTEKGMDL